MIGSAVVERYCSVIDFLYYGSDRNILFLNLDPKFLSSKLVNRNRLTLRSVNFSQIRVESSTFKRISSELVRSRSLVAHLGFSNLVPFWFTRSTGRSILFILYIILSHELLQWRSCGIFSFPVSPVFFFVIFI